MEFKNRPEQAFSRPEEEVAFLRERLKHAEEKALKNEQPVEKVGEEVTRAYAGIPSEEVLAPEAIIPEHESEAIVLKLAPEAHDAQMAELLGILQEKGIRNALSVVAKMNNVHIEDDLHRFLVQYIREGHPVSGVKEKGPLWQALHMTLYEVALPHTEEDERSRELKLRGLISTMEQFYAGMRAVTDEKTQSYFTIEIAQQHIGEEVVVYVSVPEARRDLFEKQILAIFPHAHISEQTNDYNIFAEGGEVSASYATLTRHASLPIKTYDTFDTDPLNVVLNSFSKLQKEGEGASLQLFIRPSKEGTLAKYQKTIEKIQKGESFKEAIGPQNFFESTEKFVGSFLSKSKDKEEDKKIEEPKKTDEKLIARLQTKVSAPLFDVALRVVASAGDTSRAEQIRGEIESSFHQFEEGEGNGFSFKPVSKGGLKELLHNFSFRLWGEKETMVLNTHELTTVVHFPSSVIEGTTQLRRTKASTSAAPLSTPEEGIVLGINRDRGAERTIRFAPDDRLRHFYCVGQTGTGKTTILKNMIIQDIENGEGVCMIDPHGTDIEDVLSAVPKERADDVIYFDPAYTARPMGLNMLEFDERYPEQKTFVVDELLSIFNKLFDMKVAGGPMFEQYFRNAALLVMDDSASGNTLLDLSRVLADKTYRELKLSRSKNPIVIQFWREVAEKAGGEASLANIVPYITSKFDVFLSNEIMRPVIAQSHSAFNFRKIMDEKKILLVNLSKGRLGDINANLIGLILVGKILMASLSRVDAPRDSLPPFYLYIDEFQNITTDSIAKIFSEARKYGLGLNVAHQFISQIEENIRNSVFGNVGSICAFRTSIEDGEYLAKQFAPTFTAQDISNLDNHNAYLRLLVHGVPERPFNITTLPPAKMDESNRALLKEHSYTRFGRPREEVEAEIMARYTQRPIEGDDSAVV